MRPVFILGIILLLVGCKQRDERVLMVVRSWLIH